MTSCKIADLPDQFITDLKNGGLSYEEMMEDYNLTRWGARKVGDLPVIGEEVAGNHEKIFVLPDDAEIGNVEVPLQEPEVNHEEETRQTSSAKQTITKKANTYLTELEREVKNTETPETRFEEPGYTGKGFTALIHETDPHFSAKVTDRSGEVVYDTDTCVQATGNAFEWYVEQIVDFSSDERQLEEIVLMLGGDLVEGEDIYNGQAHHIDETLEYQISEARRTYFRNIKRLASLFDVPVKVVCVSGNHGNMKTSSKANADDIIYSQLEDMVDLSDLENVKFVKSDRSDYTTFTFRNWNGYVTHGENRSQHIGTSSPQSDWLAIKERFNFDLAFRGHYHNQKVENVNGSPVVMTNARKPGDDYTDKIATFGVTGNAIYFATDEEPLARMDYETGVLPR